MRVSLLIVLACLSLTASGANVGPALDAPLPAVRLNRGATAAPLTLSGFLRDPDVPGTAVRITVRVGTQTGTIDLALFDEAKPKTVANFLGYVDADHYDANILHRSVPGFILQSGGFFFIDEATYGYVATTAPVQNEPGISNTRGTIAMAKLGGDPDSATSQWFINLADNSTNLDAQNGGFTVFGRVLGTGMQVADAIASVPRYNLSGAPLYESAWTDIPLTTPSLARANFVESWIARVPALAHQAVADDPSLVTVNVVNGALSLVAAPDRSGATTVRITSTDLEGASLVSTVAVTVLDPDAYVAWRQIHFATTLATGPAADTADPDGDGVVNFLEYALGTSPLSPDAKPPAASVAGGRLTLTHTRIADPALTYTVEGADSLAGPWSTIAAPGNPGTGANNVAGTFTVTDTVALATAPRRFLRLRVSR